MKRLTNGMLEERELQCGRGEGPYDIWMKVWWHASILQRETVQIGSWLAVVLPSAPSVID